MGEAQEDNHTGRQGKSQENPEPHPKDGHLRLPNSLVEKFSTLRLTGSQWQILWAIWRRTLCWQKAGQWGSRAFPIGTAEIAAATGTGERQIKREMHKLIAMNIILRDNTTGGRGQKPMTAFNLDPSTWKVPLVEERKGGADVTLSVTVPEMTPFPSEKSGKDDTLSPETPSKKGDTLATVSDRKMTPFRTQDDTLSQAKSKLLNKHINKHKETGVPPTRDELKILDTLRQLEGWRYDEIDDLAWLRDFTQEFDDFDLSQLRAARDWHSGRPVPKHKGGWKTRLRNWMRKKEEFERREQRGPRGKSFEQYLKEQQEAS